MAMPTNKQLHQFILDCFDDEELEQFCFLYFPEVRRNHFGYGMSMNRKAIELIDYCDRHQILENLLAALAQEREKLYQQQFAAQQKYVVTKSSVYTPQPRNPKQIFVSHSSKDANLAHQIAHDLQSAGYTIFITPNSIRPGEKWVPAINRGLEESGIFVVLLTPDAIQSGWVQNETNVAIALATENEARLFLLDVQDCRPPILWRQRQFLSFRDKDYRRNLDNLLMGLKEESRLSWQTHLPKYEAELPADKKQRPEAKVKLLYEQLLQAQANSNWLSVLTLVTQIEMLIPHYRDVATLQEVALKQLQKPISKPSPTKTENPSTEQQLDTWANIRQCEAIAQDGQRCPYTAQTGSNFCRLHIKQPKVKSEQLHDEITVITSKSPPMKQVSADYDTFVHEKTGLEFLRIPSGEFIYSYKLVLTKELLYHKTKYEEGKLYLPEFWISKTPITYIIYKRFIDANLEYDVPTRNDGDMDRLYNWDKQKRTFEADKAEYPVVFVSWYDALAFCNWAGLQLPTEEQWEKAARGPAGPVYPWGNNEPTHKLCNFNNNVGGTTPVGQYSPQGDSPYGCVDMSGNVWEWCLNKYKTPGYTDIDQSDDLRVLRGGSWPGVLSNVRVAYRSDNSPYARDYVIGFRVVTMSRPSSQ